MDHLLWTQETEEFLSKLVVSKTIYAKIDRPAGIVSFQAPRDPNQTLNNWSSNVNALLTLIEKTCHLISKEVSINVKFRGTQNFYNFAYFTWPIFDIVGNGS